jgi:predicted TIM-barrel fold metal-dependent hydrolase
MNRRDFLHTSAALTTAALSLDASAADKDELPILDTHVHVWDLKQFKLPWLTADAPFAKNYLIADYVEATKGCNLAKCVYMEVDVAPEQKQKEADWIRGVIKEGKTPFVAAIVGCAVRDKGFADFAKQFKGDPYVKGLRQVVHVKETPAGFILHDDVVAAMKLLGELNLTFDLCMRHGDLQDAVKLTAKCPDTRFVLDHCGNPNVQAKDHTIWKKDLEALAKNKNVIIKISGILFTAKKGEWTPVQLAPIVNHCLDTFGPDRAIFASDWPVCTVGGTFKQWLDAVKTITKNRKEEERKKLFHDNALKFYGLK